MAHCLNCDLIKNPKSLSSSIVCQDGKIFFRFIDNANEYFIIFPQSYQVFRVTQHYPTWTRTPWLFSRNTQRKLFSIYKPLTKVFNLLVKTVYDKFGKIANVTPRVALTSLPIVDQFLKQAHCVGWWNKHCLKMCFFTVRIPVRWFNYYL